jgi:gamma-glutamylcyclotransferase (GGCT)/AIG2-like uncharacterized protein YtfP
LKLLSLTSDSSSQHAPSTASVHFLFIYGTLKRGFHWNSKYLHPRLGARFIAEALTLNKHSLVVGDCGVPYLLYFKNDIDEDTSLAADKGVMKKEVGQMNDGKDLEIVAGAADDDGGGVGGGSQIKGELWEVDDYCLKGLDDYEGMQKGYYQRVVIPVVVVMRTKGEKEDKQSVVQREEQVIMANVNVLVDSSLVNVLQKKELFSEYSLELHERLYKPILHIQVKQCNYYKQPSNWGKTSELIEGTYDIPHH